MATQEPIDHEAGRVSYEAYCNQTGNKSLATGDNLPTWHSLPHAIREAWAEAAKAAGAVYIRGDYVHSQEW